jgi:DNA-binding NarL/FixJ family response regulator
MIDILLVDDHKILREGIRTLLEKQPKLKVVAEAGSGKEALQLLGKIRPDIVIMDISMSDLDGIEATRKTIKLNPAAKVIMLSMHSEKHFIIEAFQAGAMGYLLKDCALEELVSAIDIIMENKKYISPSITDIIINSSVSNSDNVKPENHQIAELSEREHEVLQLLCDGKNTKETAVELGVCAKTVETHRTNIMNKLNIHNMADLVKYAIRKKLIII